MTVGAPPASPFKGLAPFEDSDLDELLFFGREREREIIVANVVASRLTVLYGPSGVGKSSLLRAGVARRLREEPDVDVVLFDAWSERDPLATVVGALGADGETIAQAVRARGRDTYFLFDQFEEFFLYHDPDGPFAKAFAAAASMPGLRANFLLSLREDSIAALDAFKSSVPALLANRLRLDHLGRAAARAAIVGPLDRYGSLVGENVDAEPALLDAVLDEVRIGQLDLGAGGRGGFDANGSSRVEAAYLQLVMQRLWEVERERGSRMLRLATLRELGGAERIVREHLERALTRLTPEERDLAAAAFHHLLTPSGTKIAHAPEDLARYAGVDAAQLQPILRELSRARIVRAEQRDGGRARYEIYHDLLADAVLAWRARHESERAIERERRAAEKRVKRLAAVAAAAVAAVAAMVAVTVFALTQRSEAREQARAAEARTLVAEAAASLQVDPLRSLRFAVDAARLEPTARVEDVLRRALLEPYPLAPPDLARRGAFPSRTDVTRGGVTARARGETVVIDTRGSAPVRIEHGAAVNTVDVDPAGRLVVTAGQTRVVRLWDARTGRLLREIGKHAAPVLVARFSPDGAAIATGSVDGGVRLFETRTAGLTASMFGHGNHVTDVDFSADARFVVSGSFDRTARIWETASGRVLGVMRGHPSGVARVSLDHPRAVRTLGRDGTMIRFDARAEPDLPVLARFGGPVEGAWFGAGDRTIEVAQADRGAVVDSRTGAVVRTTATPPEAPASAGEIDGAAVRLDSGVVLRGHQDRVTSSRVSRDGRLIVTASRDTDARVWDARSGRLVRILRGHFGPVASAAFSPDAKWVVTAGPLAAGLWEVSSGRLVFFMRGHTAALTSASFDGSGRRIVTASEDGTVRVYRCVVCGGIRELAAVAEARLRRAGV